MKIRWNINHLQFRWLSYDDRRLTAATTLVASSTWGRRLLWLLRHCYGVDEEKQQFSRFAESAPQMILTPPPIKLPPRRSAGRPWMVQKILRIRLKECVPRPRPRGRNVRIFNKTPKRPMRLLLAVLIRLLPRSRDRDNTIIVGEWVEVVSDWCSDLIGGSLTDNTQILPGVSHSRHSSEFHLLLNFPLLDLNCPTALFVLLI